MAEASCNCGAVAYRVEPPYRFFQYCHCTRCRKRSGSAHAANLAVPDAQFAWVRGSDVVKTWKHPQARFWKSAFCGACGSPAPWQADAGYPWLVPAGSLDEDPGERPTRNIHFASRAVWYTPAASLEHHDEDPPRRT